MANARMMVFVKLMLDLIAAILTLVIYFVYTFQYMDNFRISMMTLEYRTEKSDVTTIASASPSTLCDHFCPSTGGVLGCKDVCRHDDDFKTAGILFISFSCLSLLITLYCVCNLLGMTCGCTCFGFFKLKALHFGIPFGHALATVLYTTVSRVFTLSKGDYSDSYEVKVGPGLVLIFAVMLIELISACYFIYALKNGIEDILMVTQTGYRATPDPFLKVPADSSIDRNSSKGKR